jgi:hypothetical protein
MYKRLLFFIIILCQLATLHAQQLTIAGRVADEETQKPIEFASILMKETDYGPLLLPMVLSASRTFLQARWC